MKLTTIRSKKEDKEVLLYGSGVLVRVDWGGGLGGGCCGALEPKAELVSKKGN